MVIEIRVQIPTLFSVSARDKARDITLKFDAQNATRERLYIIGSLV